MLPSAYDLKIYKNPDAFQWAKFFMEQNPNVKVDEETMFIWFSNAMGAMHDYLVDPPDQEVVYGDWCNDNK